MSEKPAAAPATGKGSKSKLLLIVGAVVVLAGGGGGYYWYSQKAAAAAAEEAGHDEDEDEGDAEADHGDNDHGDQGDHAEKKPTKKKKKKKAKKKDHGEHHARLMTFEPFVVNLADEGSARFLRTNVQLVVSGGEEGGGGHGGPKGPSVEEMRLRSAILELLSAETSDKLTTPAGKDELKAHILERAEELLEAAEIEVEDVLFSDFVIQF